MFLNFITLNNYNVADSFLSKLKAFLRISHNDDDEILKILFTACVNFVYNKTEILIGKRDFKALFQLDSNEFSLSKQLHTTFIVTAIKVNGISVNFSVDGYNIKIDERNIKNKSVEAYITCENNFFPQDLIVAIFRHVFFLYENRGMVGDNSGGVNASFQTQEIERLYQPFIQKNFNI